MKRIIKNMLPECLREERERAGISQKELGERLGLSASYISYCENGVHRFPDDKLELFAKELAIDVMKLYHAKNEKWTSPQGHWFTRLTVEQKQEAIKKRVAGYRKYQEQKRQNKLLGLEQTVPKPKEKKYTFLTSQTLRIPMECSIPCSNVDYACFEQLAQEHGMTNIEFLHKLIAARPRLIATFEIASRTCVN